MKLRSFKTCVPLSKVYFLRYICFQLGPSQQTASSLDFLGQPTGLGGLSEIFSLAQSPTYVPPQEVRYVNAFMK